MEKPTLTIRYCTGCQWLLRAAYFAQEILSTFSHEIRAVELVPETEVGGTFQVLCGATTIWDRTTDGGFPQAAELKRRIRDQIAPDKSLGHVEPTDSSTRK
jgi:selenoprotein W-related protein